MSRNLRDYSDPLYRYTSPPHGEPEHGTVAEPVQLGPGLDSANETESLIERQAFANWWEYRRQMLGDPPREARFFLASSGEVSVPSGTKTIVASYTVPDDYVGKLEKIATIVTALASYPSVQWFFQVNGAPYLGLDAFVASDETSEQDGLVLQLLPGQTYSLAALQTTGVAVSVIGLLRGWIEYRSMDKPWGNNSGGV